MSATRPSRPKTSTKKLEPIDWHEFANDAVLNGNMSTLYHRPATEDPSAYASAEALVEIEKRGGGTLPTVGPEPTVATLPTVAPLPTGGKVKVVQELRDALTLAGHILYQAMYGGQSGAASKTCTKGYRELAAETRLDKDTVRDLIREFKEKGVLRETGRYNADTRLPKTYEVYSENTILDAWRQAGLYFVTAGRGRPTFCNGKGEPLRPNG